MCASSLNLIYDKIQSFLKFLLSLPATSPLVTLIVFLVSLISNSVPYISVPYLALILLYSSYWGVQDLTHSTLIVLSSALGAAIGKIVVYYLGKGVSNLVISSSNEAYIKLLSKFLDKSIFLSIIIFAATPLPDDILYIPVGVLRYPLLKFFISCFIGKLILTAFVFYSGGFIHSLMKFSQVQDVGIVATIVSILVTAIVLLFMRYLDWAKLVEVIVNYGVVKGSLIFVTRPHHFIRRSKGGQ